MDPVLEQRIRAELEENRRRRGPAAGARPVPPIPAARYGDPRLHALEGARVWRRCWLLAAHESELAAPGDYLTFDRTGAPIVIVRGDDGALSAFYNSCRHRGAPVVRDRCGTARRLTCAYHSWSYDLAGRLRGLPDAREFVDLDRTSLGLVPVRCESWEGWVFVNEDRDAPPLTEFLGPLCDQTIEIGGPSLRKLGTQSYRVDANWKVVVDAFLEVYHIRTVHPDNAALLYDDSTVSVAMLRNGHSRLSVAVRPEMLGVMDPSPEADNPRVGRLWRETSTSFGWFPNVVAALDTGAFPLLCAWPIDEWTSELELRWFAPDWGGGAPPEEHRVRMSLFETVMAQDTANLAAIQRSVAARGVDELRIGWHERLIHHFHRSLDRAIGADRLPGDLAVSDALDDLVEPA